MEIDGMDGPKDGMNGNPPPLGKSDIDRIAGEIRGKAEALLVEQEGREIPGLSHGKTIEDLLAWALPQSDGEPETLCTHNAGDDFEGHDEIPGNVREVLKDMESVIVNLARDIMFYVHLQEVNSEVAHKLLTVFMVAADICQDKPGLQYGPTTRNLMALKKAVFSP